LNKAEVPWFVLVPETAVIELCDLNAQEQALLQTEVNLLSRFVRDAFDITKLNVAAIGNIVAQLHIHVIGRHPADAWWPQVVWGQTSAGGYDAARIGEIAAALATRLGADYRTA
jgi:diadenosine tetraphosphate (Ap4A) HIT family hydrolase